MGGASELPIVYHGLSKGFVRLRLWGGVEVIYADVTYQPESPGLRGYCLRRSSSNGSLLR